MFTKICAFIDTEAEAAYFNTAIPEKLRARLNAQKLFIKSKENLIFVEKSSLPESIREQPEVMRALFLEPKRENLVVTFSEQEFVHKMVDVFSNAPRPIPVEDREAFLNIMSKAYAEGVVHSLQLTVGHGKKHAEELKKIVRTIEQKNPWMEERMVSYVVMELMYNVQAANLRRIAERCPRNEPSAAFFHVTFNHKKDAFFEMNIREYGEEFDYIEYYIRNKMYRDDFEVREFNDYSEYSTKPVLKENNTIEVLETIDSGRGLPIVEWVTDNVFYFSSIFHNVTVNGVLQKKFDYKFIYMRIDKDDPSLTSKGRS